MSNHPTAGEVAQYMVDVERDERHASAVRAAFEMGELEARVAVLERKLAELSARLDRAS